MAENDIYNNKRRYESFVENIESLIKKPIQGSKGVYYCKNSKNLKYFYKLVKHFEAKDLSFVRRVRVFQCLKCIVHAIEKDLVDCDREDLNLIVAFMHQKNKSPTSKRSFIRDIKAVWRVLFPELDERGRIDETLTPYAVRHLSARVDKSKEKMRNEKYTIEEFEKIIQHFDNDPKMQAFLTSVHETYTRPQELLYLKLRNFEFFDNYGLAYVCEHGKEGTKVIQFENLSYPYILKWYKAHPLKKNPDSFFFLVEANNGKYKQLTPDAINHKLRTACRELNIDKKVTCYSLKRMGITIDRMNGVPDKIIIAKAGWANGKQLATYDLGTRNEALRRSLIQKGLVQPKDENEKKFLPQQKVCSFCHQVNGYTEELCNGCHRPLDREKIQKITNEQELLAQNALIQRLAQLEIEIKNLKKS
ncbi:site-specific integrase [Candidatus Woesearchaeota archaeon]|nr:site-specific integrase [Candidatus Woesearchaeota archaeon]